LEAAVGPSPVKVPVADHNQEIADLKQRMAKMEETMSLVMAQNAQLLALLKRS